MSQEIVYTEEQLLKHCQSLFIKHGVPEEDALIVSRILIQAELEGVKTHGISRIPSYLKKIDLGTINPRPNISIIKENPASIVLDGDNGLGQVISYRATEMAMDLAEKASVGIVSVRNSNHFGAASYYCQMAAKRDFIGLAFTNSPPGIPPWGSKKAYFGTNPISFGFPTAGEFPIIIDMATSITARGNIILAAKKGEKIPLGWALDQEGKPTEDPHAALAGAVLPMAGAKGYALALAVEILSALLSGAEIGINIPPVTDLEGKANIGHLIGAINIDAFINKESFKKRLLHMIEEIKEQPLAYGHHEILIPGERRYKEALQRGKEGIKISADLAKELELI